ncbi:MAG: lipoyl(octanoyl) transferase LipB [Deltaproteobacteria bacterium]|nr:lipoyl(octanoyl) transferase LipB [Deltaproteobacteria bacterium]
MNDLSDKKWLCIELPATEYREAWRLQSDLVAARKDKSIDTDVVLLLEHPPVFTVGNNSGMNNLTVSKKSLEKAGIPLIRVERGGDITFHGPGQLVMYPIIDLHAARLSVLDYIEKLEEVMIKAAHDWGIMAQRNPANRGVWVGKNKLGSVGIAIRRGVSFHGMALNVNLSLEPFGWINPCGLQEITMTSMEQELSHRVAMNQVSEAVKRHLEAVFGVELVITGLSELPGLQYNSHRHTRTHTDFSPADFAGENSCRLIRHEGIY